MGDGVGEGVGRDVGDGVEEGVGPSHLAVSFPEQEEWAKLPSLEISRSVNNNLSSKFQPFGKV